MIPSSRSWRLTVVLGLLEIPVAALLGGAYSAYSVAVFVVGLVYGAWLAKEP